jgi:hypothetical protein
VPLVNFSVLRELKELNEAEMSENKEEFDSIRYALSKKYVKEETQYMIDSSNY